MQTELPSTGRHTLPRLPSSSLHPTNSLHEGRLVGLGENCAYPFSFFIIIIIVQLLFKQWLCNFVTTGPLLSNNPLQLVPPPPLVGQRPLAAAWLVETLIRYFDSRKSKWLDDGDGQISTVVMKALWTFFLFSFQKHYLCVMSSIEHKCTSKLLCNMLLL
jgi:hypothetical protein